MTFGRDDGPNQVAERSSTLRFARHHERGQVLVEFALAGTIGLTLIFGIIDFGRALFTYDLVGNAARIGTRYAIVNATPCSNGVTSPCETAITNYILSKSPGLDSSKLQPPVYTWEGPSTNCPGTGQPGCYVRVALSYNFSFVLLPLPAQTLASSSQMVISQ
ncbi:MAG: TadE/TadG family type IV pilus assembly protein [Vulcanimicrobiaceae bacterium]